MGQRHKPAPDMEFKGGHETPAGIRDPTREELADAGLLEGGFAHAAGSGGAPSSAAEAALERPPLDAPAPETDAKVAERAAKVIEEGGDVAKYRALLAKWAGSLRQRATGADDANKGSVAMGPEQLRELALILDGGVRSINDAGALIADMEAANASLVQQAQIWHGEAGTANAIIQAIYRICGQGSAGDWNGSQPVADFIARICSESIGKQARIYALEAKMLDLGNAWGDGDIPDGAMILGIKMGIDTDGEEIGPIVDARFWGGNGLDYWALDWSTLRTEDGEAFVGAGVITAAPVTDDPAEGPAT